MQILLNGEAREVDDGISVEILVREVMGARRHVAVEINREIVPRSRHGVHRLRPGDRVELVTAIGGG